MVFMVTNIFFRPHYFIAIKNEIPTIKCEQTSVVTSVVENKIFVCFHCWIVDIT